MNRKEIVPNDFIYNKLYPFPTNLPKGLAMVALISITMIFLFTVVSMLFLS